MSVDEKKRNKRFLTSEKWYKVIGIASTKTNMLINYQLLNGAAT